MSQKIKEMRFGRIEVEKRSEGETAQSRTIKGYALKFDKWSDPIYDYFIEKINRHAFDGCNFSDCIASFNHDESKILARTSSGTLTLFVDDIGLGFRFDAPDTTVGNDVLEMVRRGDVYQCSFLMTVEEEQWTYKKEGELHEREILKVSKLYDVALVTYAAYPDTEVTNARAAFEKRCAQATAPKQTDADMLDIEVAYQRYKQIN